MRELTAWPFMSGEPAMMVRLLLDATEELMATNHLTRSVAVRELEEAFAEDFRRWHGSPAIDVVRAPHGVPLKQTFDRLEVAYEGLYKAWQGGRAAEAATHAADMVVDLFNFARGFGLSVGDFLLARLLRSGEQPLPAPVDLPTNHV